MRTEAKETALLAGASVLRVLNKIDLPVTRRAASGRRFDVETSALTGEGIAALVAAIGAALVPESPAAGDAVPFTAEQIAQLERALLAARKRDSKAVAGRLRPLIVNAID